MRNREARFALATGVDRRSALAVQAGREDLRHRGLARPARADEQVGVVDLPALHGVAQRAHDRLLADDVGERTGPVPAIERLGLRKLCLRLWLVDRHRCPESTHGRGAGRSGSGRVRRGPLDRIACPLVRAWIKRLAAPFAIAAGAVVLWVAAGVGFANYDTLY